MRNYFLLGLAPEDRQQLADVVSRLTRIEQKLDRLIAQENSTTMTLADLKVQVEKNTAAEEGAVTLINGIAAQLAAAKTDPVAIQALADELTASGADLAAAITANTPAAPAPTGGTA